MPISFLSSLSIIPEAQHGARTCKFRPMKTASFPTQNACFCTCTVREMIMHLTPVKGRLSCRQGRSYLVASDGRNLTLSHRTISNHAFVAWCPLYLTCAPDLMIALFSLFKETRFLKEKLCFNSNSSIWGTFLYLLLLLFPLVKIANPLIHEEFLHVIADWLSHRVYMQPDRIKVIICFSPWTSIPVSVYMQLRKEKVKKIRVHPLPEEDNMSLFSMLTSL